MGRRKAKPEPEAREGSIRMVALDVSSVAVGYSVFDGTSLVAYGKYLQGGKDHGQRLSGFRTFLLATLARYKPNHLVTEMPYAGRRRYTYGILMLYLSVVLQTHWEYYGYEMPSEDRVAAHQVKRRLQMQKGADHESRKRQMVTEINRLYGLNLKFKAKDKTKRVSDDDVADAIAVGRARLLHKEKDDVEL